MWQTSLRDRFQAPDRRNELRGRLRVRHHLRHRGHRRKLHHHLHPVGSQVTPETRDDAFSALIGILRSDLQWFQFTTFGS